MHETFKIIRPFLEEHGISINPVAPSWRAREESTVAYKMRTSDWEYMGELIVEGTTIRAWQRTTHVFDLHDPTALPRLVEYLQRLAETDRRGYSPDLYKLITSDRR